MVWNVCLLTLAFTSLIQFMFSSLHSFLSKTATLTLLSVGVSYNSHLPHLISQIVLKDVLCKQISIYILNICKSYGTCTLFYF